jgi:H+/Cl- antiporter ClcA
VGILSGPDVTIMSESINETSPWIETKSRLLLEKLPDWLPKDMSYWIAAFITGIAAVGYAAMVRFAESFSRHIFSDHPYMLLLFSPLCFIVSWWLVYRIAPEAKGSGIPQVMAAISSFDVVTPANPVENPRLEKLLGLKTAVVKVLSSLFCILGGGAVGREGPTIQIAASIFHFINRKTDRYLHKTNLQFGLIAGGGAGIAAAFNTPLGGLVYAIEELATLHFSKFKTSLISGVIVAGLVSQWLLGSYLYLGYPPISPITAETVLLSSLVGAVTGGFGALFGILLFNLGDRVKRFKKMKELVVVAGLCGLAVALMAILLDGRAIGTGREVVIQLLFKDGAGSDFKLALVRFFSPVASYLSGGAGGIFAPSLAAGGAIGSLLADLFSHSHETIFILVGMIGFLTGVTHAPFTSFVLVLEMTDRHTAILPMMLASLFASSVAKLMQEHSFYERIKVSYLELLRTPENEK